jgi:hypothetical protein
MLCKITKFYILYIYFDIFESQIEIYCKRHRKAPALNFYDHGIS